jgi:hypothetical protein
MNRPTRPSSKHPLVPRRRAWQQATAALVAAATAAAPLAAAAQASEMPDLVYERESHAAQQLPARGYTLSHTQSARQGSYWQYWWNAQRSQCLRVAVNNLQVTQIISTSAGDCQQRGGSGGGGWPLNDGIPTDLAYRDAGYASNQLSYRGYVLSHSASAKDGAYWQYWWSHQRAQCLRIAVNRDQVTQVIRTDEHDCNQHVSGSSGPSKGAQVAIAAAAIAGVAALAHKSHESDKDRAAQSPQEVAEFERGYRDGMYHQGYHNYNNSRDYGAGYNKGTERRDAETSYRSSAGAHSGYAGYVNLIDLNGVRGSSAEDELRARGFASRGGYKEGNRSINTWWNGNTRQCVNVAVQDGRVANVSPIPDSNCR